MIYPYTELKYVNDVVGYGVFATQFIPKGTVIYAEDPLDRVITLADYTALPVLFQPIVKKFGYVDWNGNYVLCWDIAKHMNHCCECNTLSTAYGFDIAIRDIQAGEELTDDYGLFNLEEEMNLSCRCSTCRLVLRRDDFERCYPDWDRKIQAALKLLNTVPQPMQRFIDPAQWWEAQEYLNNKKPYRSVIVTRYIRV